MRQASLEKIGLAVLGLGVWLSILVRVWTHFDPASQFASSWNSDLAIPVLQSNDPVFDPFRFYYYGQDRLGAWPWLLAQGWRALTGFDWTPYRLFLWHSTWVCAACFALLRLDQRKGGWVLAATFAALMLLSPGDQLQLMFPRGPPLGVPTPRDDIRVVGLPPPHRGTRPPRSGPRRGGMGRRSHPLRHAGLLDVPDLGPDVARVPGGTGNPRRRAEPARTRPLASAAVRVAPGGGHRRRGHSALPLPPFLQEALRAPVQHEPETGLRPPVGERP